MNYFELNLQIENFIKSLKKSEYSFKPVLNGSTESGLSIELGFTCYAIKTLYTINSPVVTDSKEIKKYTDFIKSFSKSKKGFPYGSFIDENYLNSYKKKYFLLLIKNIAKFTLARIKFLEISPNFKLKEFISAETKQSLSTLKQLGIEFSDYSSGFPNNELSIKKYSNSLDWSKPWNAGAQLSGICIFNSYTNNKDKIRKIIDDILKELVQSDGAYYQGKNIGDSEKINGAMKVITGMDWLGIEIHKPKELIDICLSHKPNSEGCDLVDVVYVLFKCNQLTDYKHKDIEMYLESLLPSIMSHYHADYGGFSYFKNKSQTHYYGVEISYGHNSPDIHGTTLLVWALAMIFKILGDDYPNWSIIKP